MPRGPCAKQTVTATVVLLDGRSFIATNDCANPQGAPAEVIALALAAAAGDTVGATLYLAGHTYACEGCKAAAIAAGVAAIAICAPSGAIIAASSLSRPAT
jgi:deoxycytidylate deaminase